MRQRCHAPELCGSLLSLSRLLLGAGRCACGRFTELTACLLLRVCRLCCSKIEEATRISAERLESQLHKVKQTIEDDREKVQETPYALIIDGKALLYALSPRLRQLFLEVGRRGDISQPPTQQHATRQAGWPAGGGFADQLRS